jgi:hypothetical protein
MDGDTAGKGKGGSIAAAGAAGAIARSKRPTQRFASDRGHIHCRVDCTCGQGTYVIKEGVVDYVYA